MKTWIKGVATGLLTGLVILGSLPALAGPCDANIDPREMNQEERIYQGVQSGPLSPREFRHLENEPARLCAVEARMRADGRLTGAARTYRASSITAKERPGISNQGRKADRGTATRPRADRQTTG